MSEQVSSRSVDIPPALATLAWNLARQVARDQITYTNAVGIMCRRVLGKDVGYFRGTSDEYLEVEAGCGELLDVYLDREERAMTGETVARIFKGEAGFKPKPLRECFVNTKDSYRWKGIIGPGDLALCAGEPGAGKSLLGPALCHHVARGAEFMGRRTTRGPCLYLAGEGQADLLGRMQALRQRYGEADVHVIARMMNLRDEQHHAQVRAVIEQIQPVLVVQDTMAATFPGLVENDSGEMGRAVEAMRGLIEGVSSQPALLTIHHTPKGGDTPRGHSVLNGALDVTLFIRRDGDGGRSITLGKNRNGPQDQGNLGFAIEVEDCGIDQDGDVIWKPLMVENSARARGPLAKVSSNAQIAYRFLLDVLLSEGEAHKVGGDGPTVTAVRARKWLEACRRRQLVAMAEPEDDEQEAAWKRAGAMLREKRCIGVGDGFVWSLIDRPERDR